MAGPDCLADEVLSGLMGGVPVRTGRVAPEAGAVPREFEPVTVVACRLDVGEPLAEPETPEPRPLASGYDPSQAEPAVPGGGTDAGTWLSVTVEEVTLTGDLEPLLEALSRPSELIPDGLACPAIMETKPEIYLVDAGGRAVRPQWPVTACGFLHDGAAETLSALQEVSSTTGVATVEAG
ncbi:hypothetical protein [Georgenia sp. AZ-5]|uniref:hypothetical protein n=1 Tax=Georgenia sp. AZ-5 TaxID=3367526 RepID=UPI00375479B5